jgi:hypothetical protein
MYQGCTKDGYNWGGWYRISGETFNAPATTQTLGKLWWAHKGTDNNMYLKYSNTGASTRGYYSYMLWDNPGFGYNDTYEQDIFMWNGDNAGRKTYLNKNSSLFPDCMPIVKYATSNLPSAYLDTRLKSDLGGVGCEDWFDEVSFTIGSAAARGIQSNTWYVNYIETMKGDRDRPAIKISAQFGERRPELCADRSFCLGSIGFECYTTWCSWPTSPQQEMMSYETSFSINRNLTYPYWVFKTKK